MKAPAAFGFTFVRRSKDSRRSERDVEGWKITFALCDSHSHNGSLPLSPTPLGVNSMNAENGRQHVAFNKC